MEPWSSLIAGCIGLFGAVSAFLAIFKDSVPVAVLVGFPITTLVLIVIKAHFDDRIAWFKYVASHLDAILKVGSRETLINSA